MAKTVSRGRYRLLAATLILAVTASVASGCAQPANVLETTPAGRQAIARNPSPEAGPSRDRLSSRSVPTAKIEILSLGDEPREVLRLPLTEGTTHAVRLSRSGQQRFSLEQQTGWMSFPNMQIDYRLTVLETDGQSARVKVQVDRALATGETNDPVIKTYADAVLNGFGGSTEVKMLQSGALFGTEPVIGPGDPSELLALGPLQRDFVTLADPLPVAAIGIGARWRITTPETLGGLNAAVINEYNLVAVTDTEIRAEVQQSILLATGEGPDLSLGASTLKGTGYAQWYRTGLVGILNVSTEGNLRFKLSPEAWLEQSLTQAIEMETLELSAPEPEPDPEADAGAEADEDGEGTTKPDADGATKPEDTDENSATKPEGDTDTDVASNNESDPAEPKPDGEPKPNAEPKPDGEPKPNAEPDPAANPAPGDPKPGTEPSTNAKPGTAAEAEAEPGPDNGPGSTEGASAGPEPTERGNGPNN